MSLAIFTKPKNIMTKVKLLSSLKVNEHLDAKLIEQSDEFFILETQKGDRIKTNIDYLRRCLTVTDTLNPILRIERKEDGYHVYELETWENDENQDA